MKLRPRKFIYSLCRAMAYFVFISVFLLIMMMMMIIIHIPSDNITANVPRSGFFDQTDNLTVNECDITCQQFDRDLQFWPKNKPKAAVYILIKTTRTGTLKTLMHSLDKYFNNQFQYPVIVFHESDLTAPMKEDLRSNTMSDIYFQEIQFPPVKKKSFHEACSTFPLSYRNMCYFQTIGVYREPILHKLDYLWRLDGDSLLLEPIKYDVFNFMQENSYLYGYIWETYEDRRCIVNLWNVCREYTKRKNIIPKNRLREAIIYYNNFEISASKLWFSKEYQDFASHIASTGGIHYYRWGDAPIKSIAVSLFVPNHQTYWFRDIGYKHQHFNQSEYHWKAADLLKLLDNF